MADLNQPHVKRLFLSLPNRQAEKVMSCLQKFQKPEAEPAPSLVRTEAVYQMMNWLLIFCGEETFLKVKDPSCQSVPAT